MTLTPWVSIASAWDCCLRASWSAFWYRTSHFGHSSLSLASMSGRSKRLVPGRLRLGQQQADLEALVHGDAGAAAAAASAVVAVARREAKQKRGDTHRGQSAPPNDSHLYLRSVPPGTSSHGAGRPAGSFCTF